MASRFTLRQNVDYAASGFIMATSDSIAGIAQTRGHARPERVAVVRYGPDFARSKAVPPRP
jgi:hypothetical protein